MAFFVKVWSSSRSNPGPVRVNSLVCCLNSILWNLCISNATHSGCFNYIFVTYIYYEQRLADIVDSFPDLLYSRFSISANLLMVFLSLAMEEDGFLLSSARHMPQNKKTGGADQGTWWARACQSCDWSKDCQTWIWASLDHMCGVWKSSPLLKQDCWNVFSYAWQQSNQWTEFWILKHELLDSTIKHEI